MIPNFSPQDTATIANGIQNSVNSTPNIFQSIMALAAKNNASQQVSPTSGMPNTGSGGMGGMGGAEEGSLNSPLGQLHLLSRTMGYDPGTMFGYNMGGLFGSATPAVTGGAAPAAVADASAPAAAMGTGAAASGATGTAAGAGGALSNMFGALWSML